MSSLAGQREGMAFGLVVAVAATDEAHAGALECSQLDRRRCHRDHHRGASAEAVGREGDSQPVVAGRRRDDGSVGVAAQGAGDGDQGAAHLERARRVERLQLHRHVSAEARDGDHRRHAELTAHDDVRGYEVGRLRRPDRSHGCRLLTSPRASPRRPVRSANAISRCRRCAGARRARRHGARRP